MSRRLKGEVLRGFADHRTRIGRAYTQLVRDKQAELGTFPKSAKPLLREWARIILELNQSVTELQKPSLRKRPTDFRRLRREVKVQRLMMLKLDQRLRYLAGLHQEATDPMAALFAEETAS